MQLVIEESDLEKFIVVGDRVLIKPKSPQEKDKNQASICLLEYRKTKKSIRVM